LLNILYFVIVHHTVPRHQPTAYRLHTDNINIGVIARWLYFPFTVVTVPRGSFFCLVLFYVTFVAAWLRSQ